MRLVAAIVLGLLVAAMPTSPAAPDRLNLNDECYNEVTPGASGGSSCLRVDMPAQTPPAVTDAAGNRIFVWLSAVDCATPCPDTSRPNAYTAIGWRAYVGLVWSDTNGYPGLQRAPRFISGTPYAADTVVLV